MNLTPPAFFFLLPAFFLPRTFPSVPVSMRYFPFTDALTRRISDCPSVRPYSLYVGKSPIFTSDDSNCIFELVNGNSLLRYVYQPFRPSIRVRVRLSIRTHVRPFSNQIIRLFVNPMNGIIKKQPQTMKNVALSMQCSTFCFCFLFFFYYNRLITFSFWLCNVI